MDTTDLERAIAVLSLGHKLVPYETAQAIIENGRAGADMAVALSSAVGETALLAAIAVELRLHFVDLHAHDSDWRVDDDVATALGVDTLKTYSALPLRHTSSGALAVALANPRAQSDVVEWIRSQLEQDVLILLAPKAQIDAKLVYLDASDFSTVAAGDVDPARSGAAPTVAVSNPVVEFVDNLLARAVAEDASDVHFLSQADGTLLIRFRVDGVMRRQAVPLRRHEREIIGTLLAKCGDNIDSSDRTRPQDGTFSFIAPGGRRIDARLGMLPQAYGPTIVVRLLDPENINRRLEDMGFSTATLNQVRRVLREPQGAVLFMGPTGSGKTTTLYALLKELPAGEMSILTAEDPIEYRLASIGQTQIRSDLGSKSLTFGKVLRSMLRLDPDVVLIGEIRDAETAGTAMEAALTGHMVLSTLHAKNAVAAYARLEELEVDPYLSSESLSLAVNQRLVRTLHTCRTMGPATEREKEILARHRLPVPDLVAHPAVGGCGGCDGTGYRGRAAVVEVMEPTEELKELVASRAPRKDIQACATSSGYTSILSDAYRHVQTGRMPVAELLRVVGAGQA